ncbi:Sedlin [Schizopora paradoxa]|uniref:Trafficking protein particle complex subunit 2-like protein n=1 Tax=Schizopora paradoxa TaxID=27342 RepID=A0A0H2S717_9AGAM|nr:Sedlin [Schizopora paradoxa]
MAPSLQVLGVGYISPQNQPILIRYFSGKKKDGLKFHYIAHTSLDVFEERKCYLGLLYAMDDFAVYGYITPLRVKIVLTIALTDNLVRDADVTMIFRALHMAYYHALANPFLRLDAPYDAVVDHTALLVQSKTQWKGFRRRVDEVARACGVNVPPDGEET